MRISELSERSGVSVASIKFYIREGLLAPGERTGYNQTEYGSDHADRLRLIRALTEAGGLPLSAASRVLAAVDDPGLPLDHALGVAQRAIPRPIADASPEAVRRVTEFARSHGWTVHPDNPGIPLVASVLDGYAELGRADLGASLGEYARAADIVAAVDLDLVEASGDRERMIETVVVGTVLGDRLLAGARRIAQASQSHRRHGGATSRPDRPPAPAADRPHPKESPA